MLARGRIVVLAGPGLLQEAGLQPPEIHGGLWDRFGVERCATPEALYASPDLAWEAFSAWLSSTRAAICDDGHVSEAHSVLLGLQKRGLLRGVIVTTTDGLLRSIGIERSAELFGAIDRVRCEECRWRGEIDRVEARKIPVCARCGGELRPDMVLFGEMMPRAPREKAASMVYGGGSLLVLGADITRPPLHRIPEEMMQEGGKTIALGCADPGAVRRVRGIVGGAVGELPALFRCVVASMGD